ncbi:MAG: DUF962 domain-containing protein [Bacteroidetes bacterium]|nr:DUF962 domain-containing protein [Bacteroidota bacterium]
MTLKEIKFLSDIRLFYPEYLLAHSDKMNKILHFIGASITTILLLFSIVFQVFWLILFAVVIGYTLPAIGHRHYQKNESFRISRPIFCVLCATKMYIELLTGKIRFSVTEIE